MKSFDHLLNFLVIQSQVVRTVGVCHQLCLLNIYLQADLFGFLSRGVKLDLCFLQGALEQDDVIRKVKVIDYLPWMSCRSPWHGGESMLPPSAILIV